jgi:hypothetical protein
VDDRTQEIISDAVAIIRDIEGGSLALSRVALRARRLAQTLDDDAAFAWLSLECAGATPGVKPERLTHDLQDAMRGLKKWMKLHAALDVANLDVDKVMEQLAAGKQPARTLAFGASLAALERSLEETQIQRSLIQTAITGHQSKLVEIELRSVIDRVSIAIHEWASGVYIAHKFRALAGNIFERFKTSSDVILGELCPDAIAKLNHAIERASGSSPEEWAAAATSCRRVLKAFADAVFPPRAEPVDGHPVTDAHFVNRLYAFAKQHGSKAIERQFLALEEIEALGATAEKLNELASKGVHADIKQDEVLMAILRTYVLLMQLAQLAPPAAPV